MDVTGDTLTSSMKHPFFQLQMISSENVLDILRAGWCLGFLLDAVDLQRPLRPFAPFMRGFTANPPGPTLGELGRSPSPKVPGAIRPGGWDAIGHGLLQCGLKRLRQLRVRGRQLGFANPRLVALSIAGRNRCCSCKGSGGVRLKRWSSYK